MLILRVGVTAATQVRLRHLSHPLKSIQNMNLISDLPIDTPNIDFLKNTRTRIEQLPNEILLCFSDLIIITKLVILSLELGHQQYTIDITAAPHPSSYSQVSPELSQEFQTIDLRLTLRQTQILT